MSPVADNLSGGQLILTPQPLSNDIRLSTTVCLESLLPATIDFEKVHKGVSGHFALPSLMSSGAYAPSTSPIRAKNGCFKGNERRRFAPP